MQTIAAKLASYARVNLHLIQLILNACKCILHSLQLNKKLPRPRNALCCYLFILILCGRKINGLKFVYTFYQVAMKFLKRSKLIMNCAY